MTEQAQDGPMTLKDALASLRKVMDHREAAEKALAEWREWVRSMNNCNNEQAAAFFERADADDAFREFVSGLIDILKSEKDAISVESAALMVINNERNIEIVRLLELATDQASKIARLKAVESMAKQFTEKYFQIRKQTGDYRDDVVSEASRFAQEFQELSKKS